MDAIATFISQFKAENTGLLANIDESQKPRIVMNLEDFTDDARVIDFFLSVASNESEYDLARIEVFKILEIKNLRYPSVRARVGAAIVNVLSHSNDDDVRNYAAMAAATYIDLGSVRDNVWRILADKQEDSNLRWNAFAALKAVAASPESIDLLRRLLTEDEFKQSAARVLSEWKI